LAHHKSKEFDAFCKSAFDYPQSPIEAVFLSALVEACTSHGVGWLDICGDDRIMVNSWSPDGISITPQHKIGTYSADFVVGATGAMAHEQAIPEIVVECDGHDFHSRTKEQAAHDRKRDRFMQEEGFKVFRFTGSELWKDPPACASQVLTMLGFSRDD